MLIDAFSVHMPVSSFFIPEEQIDEHDTSKAEGRDAVCVKNLQKGVKTEKRESRIAEEWLRRGISFSKKKSSSRWQQKEGTAAGTS